MGPAWPCAFESVTPDADSNLRGFMVQWGRQAEPQVILVLRSVMRTVSFGRRGEGKIVIDEKSQGLDGESEFGPRI